MTSPSQTLGTQLRHVIELLDGAVDRRYVAAGIADYRPRYTPVMRVLLEREKASIKEIAATAALTHSAISQTVAQMAAAGFVRTIPGDDAREHLVLLTEKARAAAPRLQRVWMAANAAAAELDAELPYPLSRLLEETILALARRPHDSRLADHDCHGEA